MPFIYVPDEAWDLLWETLEADTRAGNFDRSLRQKIEAAMEEVNVIGSELELGIMELELMYYDDGTATLTYWDYEAGNDRVFSIKEDGAVYETTDDQNPVQVDLPVELLKMVKEFYGKRSER